MMPLAQLCALFPHKNANVNLMPEAGFKKIIQQTPISQKQRDAEFRDPNKYPVFKQEDGYVAIRNVDWDLWGGKGDGKAENAELRVLKIYRNPGDISKPVAENHDSKTEISADFELKYFSSALHKPIIRKFTLSSEIDSRENSLKGDFPHPFDGEADYISLDFERASTDELTITPIYSRYFVEPPYVCCPIDFGSSYTLKIKNKAR